MHAATSLLTTENTVTVVETMVWQGYYSIKYMYMYLVREDIFDLPQFLVESGCPGDGRNIFGWVVHLLVPVD